ncbi:MAG TPA: prenyltransferase/squalene oxidase repeat-containing protein [Kofleriaceae bacterium]|nr:prenyltransferase/squalene oxidase repeat-containing protein [Kofleriaceae bacterium]
MRLAILLALACACGRDPAPRSQLDEIDLALVRAAHFLQTRQSADGALRSRTYAAFKDGYTLTPLATLALRMCPRSPAIDAAYARGVAFVATIVDGDRVRDATEVRYPLYAYAIGALVLGAPDNTRYRAAHDQLLGALRELQLVERNGWLPDDPSYGGWGYATRPPRRPSDEPLEANLSATVFAIGALVLGGTAGDDPALVAARGFVERCHNADGGFVFSPALADGNKAGPAPGGGFHSYGSMTADGLRALLRLGRGLDPAATRWLDAHFDAARNPGEFVVEAEIRRDSSYFYWTWTAAHATRHLQRRAWAEALATELLRRQRLDGSWSNPASEMREDDPIVATSFAIAALVLARSVLAGEPKSHAYAVRTDRGP